MSFNLKQVTAEIAAVFPNGSEFKYYEDSLKKTDKVTAMMAIAAILSQVLRTKLLAPYFTTRAFVRR